MNVPANLHSRIHRGTAEKAVPVLALDLATTSGWAFGMPGQGTPLHGTHRFAAPDASHEAVFYKSMIWIQDLIIKHNPGLIVWEAPLATSHAKGHTNANATKLLYGLPAIVGAIAYMYKIYDVRTADTRAVRMHFIYENPKRDDAKRKVMAQCEALGWPVEDDNEADALATWSYMCSLLVPETAIRPMPLFGRR